MYLLNLGCLNSLYIGTEHQSPTPSNPQTAASTHEEDEVWSTVGMSKRHGRVDNVKSTIPHVRDRDDQQDGNGHGDREQKYSRGSQYGQKGSAKGQPQNGSLGIQSGGYQGDQKKDQSRKSVPSDRYSLTPYEGPPPRSQLAPPRQPPTKPKSPSSTTAPFSTGNNICVFLISQILQN